MLRKLLVFIALISFNVWALNDKPHVKIVALEMPGYTNSDGSGTYWEMMKATFSSNYHLHLIAATPLEFEQSLKSKSADVYIGTELTQAQNLIVANQHIDIRYPIYVLHKYDDFDVNLLSTLIVAAKKDAYLQSALPHSNGLYKVDSIKDINRLIENKRVDAALSYSYNLSLSDPNKKLHAVQLRPELKVFAGFNVEGIGQELAKVFEQNFPALILNGVIEKTFANEAEYSHSNLINHTAQQQINWHVIPKKFDPKTKKLDPVKSEVLMAEGIDSMLADVDFNIKFNSMRQLKRELVNKENTCVQNIFKTPERESFAYFSKPSYIFLQPRIIMKTERVKQLAFNELSLNGKVDMKQLFVQYPELRVSVVQGSNTDKILKENFAEEITDRFYYSQDNSLNNTFSLLLSNRVDAVITWPSLISILIDNTEVAKTLSSYQLNDFEAPSVSSYIACSKSKVGAETIDKINQVLSDESKRDKLFESEYLKMDEGSKEAFRSLLGSYYQF